MPVVETADWDMDVFEEKVQCPVEIVDEFEDLPGNSDQWGLDSSTAMEIGTDAPAVREGSREAQAVRVGGEGPDVEWATWSCTLGSRTVERHREIYDESWAVENVGFERAVAKKLAYLYTMVVPDKGWKPHAKDVADYDIRIEVMRSEDSIPIRFVFREKDQ